MVCCFEVAARAGYLFGSNLDSVLATAAKISSSSGEFGQYDATIQR